MDKLTLSKEEQKKVVEHFAKAEKVSDAQLAIILDKAGISFDDEPSTAERREQSQAYTAPANMTRTASDPAINPVPSTPAKPANPANSNQAKPPETKPPKTGNNRKIKP